MSQISWSGGSRLSTRLVRIALCLLGACAVFAATRAPASAQTPSPVVHQVGVGRFIRGAQAESMAFYPSALKVHSGDVIHFMGEEGSIPEAGVHGVLALPAGEEPLAWEKENAFNLDGEWAFFQTDPDDDPGEAPKALKGNWRSVLPSNLSCGSAENPCVTGTSPLSQTPLNSGVAVPLDYHLKVEAEPGTRIWMLCPLHTRMTIKADVVAPDEPATTPEEIEVANEAKFLRETEKAKRLDAKFSTKRTAVLRKDGSRLWDAWPGIERGTLSLFKMYPESLSIKKGDSVKWHFEDLRLEIHTVSFPLSDALAVHNAPWVTLMCDTDTDEGSAPDFEPQGGVCPSPPSDVWELDIHPRFYFPQGNGSLRGGDFESSGIRGVLAGVSHKPYKLRFPQSSGMTVWDFACQLHPTMRGEVKVR